MKNRIFSIVLALGIFINLVGCSKREKEDDISVSIESQCEVRELEQRDIIAYLKVISEVEVIYDHNEYYYDESDYEELMKIAASKKECMNESNIDEELVTQSILSNSKIAEKDIIDGLKKAINNIFTDENISSDDLCRLQDIRIEISNQENILGKYKEEENLIIINYDLIKTQYEKLQLEITFEEYLNKVIEHELNHARQFICECRENAGQINKTVSYNDGKDYPSIIIEASAESQLYNYEINECHRLFFNKSTYEYTYYRERENQALLLLMGLFKDNFDIDKYYQAINNSDIPALYDLFELKTKEDLVRFHNIIYALDTLCGRTILTKEINDLGYTNFGDVQDEVGSEYKVELFKFVIKDLINKIMDAQLSLDESLILYNFVKANILSLEADIEEINGEYIYSYDEVLVTNIGVIDEVFYEFICANFEVSKEDINIKLSNFGHDINLLCNYSDLSDEKTRSLVADLVDKYPLISEISFCCSGYYWDVQNFEENRLS